MNTYILVDVHNLFHRARHVTKGDIDVKTGLAVDIMFSSIKSIWNKFQGTHVVMCLEGRSWRKDIYPRYKRHRREAESKKTPREQEEDELFFEALNEFVKFCREETNVTVLNHKSLEADDLIAGWIDQHPDDFHVILSGDTDFLQLLNENVIMYDGVRERTIRLDGYYDAKDRPIIEKKSQKNKVPDEPEFELFKKIIRGDATDGIFSAYPRVRETKIREAYNDRHKQGFSWSNFMEQTWSDAEGKKHHVKEDYVLNKMLIDLRAQPDSIKKEIENHILENCNPKNVQQVGIRFMRFCEPWGLERHKKYPEQISFMLQAKYPKKE